MRIKQEGKVSGATMLRCRIRHFELALIIGSKSFVDTTRERCQLAGKPIQVFTNTKSGGFWIARKCTHEEVIEA